MNLHASKSLLLVLPLACSLGTSGCGTDPGTSGPASNSIPVLDTALERSYSANHGLVLKLGDHGWPLREGAAMDPVVNESRRFYDTLQSPHAEEQPVDYPDPFTGAPPSPRKTAPLTLAAWKREFNIPEQMPGESLAAYRARTSTVVYYNKNELGLGRELGCAEFDDGMPDGTKGVACYVTNYGTMFRDTHNSLRLAAEGLHAKNTVCITYRPSAPANYQVQFYTYNGDGDRREWAQLDTLGPRPLPQVCMNCHGGSYDNEKHLAKYARFLPLDPNVVVWDESTPGVTRADQEERIRAINQLSTRSPLTTAQTEMLTELYGGKLAVPGTPSKTAWYPRAWNDTQEHRELFDTTVKPNCTTCHLAMQNGPLGDTLAVYSLFKEPSSLLDTGLAGQVCGTFSMPNSQATRLNFWEFKKDPVVVNSVSYDSPADALLTAIGIDREQCQKLDTMVNCNRGPDPDELCGNAFSGQACNRVTGKCFPELGQDAPTDRSQPNGVCKTDGTRNCPYPQKCQLRAPSDPAPKGLEGFDGVCLPDVEY